MQHPTPQQLKTARLAAGLSQAKAAKLVHVSVNTWQNWEYGQFPANLACWELFLIKTKKEQQQ